MVENMFVIKGISIVQKLVIVILVVNLSGCAKPYIDEYKPLKKDLSGETLYKQACLDCHGENAQGKYGLYGLSWFIWAFTGTPDIDTDLSKQEIVEVMKNGIYQKGGGMPQFVNLDAAELERIADYVKLTAKEK